MVASLNDPYDMCFELHGVIVGVVVRMFVTRICIYCQGPPEL